MSTHRALHYVFKIGNRKASMEFFLDILGMKVLRHEEFEEGCAATCNGPYDGKWSKTMVGYGPEDTHFVCELTYNYGVSEYKMGNGFFGMYINSAEAIERAKSKNLPIKPGGIHSLIKSPDGYSFYIRDVQQPVDKDPVERLTLAVSNLDQSANYWKKLANMHLIGKTDDRAVLEYRPSLLFLTLENIGLPIDHADATGRIAFSCASAELKGLESAIEEDGQKIVAPYISLETPGKATVEVVVLADPDGHEICFVGDEGFRELSMVDPNAKEMLFDAIEKDPSNE